MIWRRRYLGWLSLTLVLIPGLVGAHAPPDEAYFAIQFPLVLEPVVDGDLGEWVNLPGSYSIPIERVYGRSADGPSQEGGEADTEDLVIRHWLGWSPNTNWLYVATEVHDNRHYSGRQDPTALWQDDTWEIAVNVDHTAPEDHNRAGGPVNTIRYIFAVPPVEGVYQTTRPGAWPWLVDGSGYVQFGWDFLGDELGEGIYSYEAAIAPIRSIADDASSPSDGVVFHDLQEGDVVHVSISLGDADGPCPECTGEKDQRLWSTSPAGGSTATNDVVLAEGECFSYKEWGVQIFVDCFGAEPCSEPPSYPYSYCASTAVEASSWARIKASFAE